MRHARTYFYLTISGSLMDMINVCGFYISASSIPDAPYIHIFQNPGICKTGSAKTIQGPNHRRLGISA